MQYCAGAVLVFFVVVAAVQCQQQQQQQSKSDAAAAVVATNDDSTELSALVALCQRYPELEVCADIVTNAAAADDDNDSDENGSFSDYHLVNVRQVLL